MTLRMAQTGTLGNDVKHEARMKRLYGMSSSQYQQLAELQGNACVICREAPTGRPLVVDHCHASGQVRGLLCNRCNVGLGNFQDNPELFYRAAAYLETAEGMELPST